MKEIPLFFNIPNFLSNEDWNTVEEILKSPGWYYGNWTNESTGQWIRYLDNDKFFSSKFVDIVNDKIKEYNLEVNTNYPKNIRANSTGYGMGGQEHADWLGEGKENWYTMLLYTNRNYHPSWGGHFYYYNNNKVNYVMPLPNTAIFFHGHIVHSWLPYLNTVDQRVNVTLSLRLKDNNE
jgi:hypothetical protein